MYRNSGSYSSRADASGLRHFQDAPLTPLGAAYVMHVLYPEDTTPVGIPSMFPYETTVIRFNTTTTVSTALTNGLIVLNPYQRPDLGGPLTHYFPLVAGASDLNAGGATPLWLVRGASTVNFASYRVVAACLKVQYIGAQDVASGFFAGASIHASVSSGDELSLDTLQEIIDNSRSSQTHWSEGMRVIWTSLDNSDSEFQSIATSPPQSGKCYISFSGFPTTGQLKVEAYITYEFLPVVEQLALFPGRRYPPDEKAKEKASEASKIKPTKYDPPKPIDPYKPFSGIVSPTSQDTDYIGTANEFAKMVMRMLEPEIAAGSGAVWPSGGKSMKFS